MVKDSGNIIDDDKKGRVFSIEVEVMVQMTGIIEGLKKETDDNHVNVTVEAIDFEFSDEEIKYLTENNIHIFYW